MLHLGIQEAVKLSLISNYQCSIWMAATVEMGWSSWQAQRRERRRRVLVCGTNWWVEGEKEMVVGEKGRYGFEGEIWRTKGMNVKEQPLLCSVIFFLPTAAKGWWVCLCYSIVFWG